MERGIILSRLLDKYEASKHLTQPGASSRRVMLRTGKKELPEYQYETAEIRDKYNAAAQGLEQEKLVQLEWVQGRPVLCAIVLNLEHVHQAYDAIGRIHPQKKAETVCALLEKGLARLETPWIKQWGRQVGAAAQKTFRVPAYCKAGTEYLADLLSVFTHYDALRGEAITMRAFSTLCFQNSKRFERDFRDEFLRIARRYNEGLAELCAQQEFGVRDQLAYLGIYARPELYELAGRCAVCTKNGRLGLGALFPYGVAIPSTAVDSITGFDLKGVRQVVFIENKTNYDAYLQTELEQDQLVIYHGGFLSPQKHKLVRKLAAALSADISVAFWADIDLGGFRMFSHLQALLPALEPMRMAAKEVERYHAYGLRRDEGYLSRLRQALNANEFPLFSRAIQKILEYGVTIEQEAFLMENK